MTLSNAPNVSDYGLISIIIPTFNINFDFVSLALDSISNQSYRNFECLIIDDSTSKESIIFLKDYCATHSNFTYYGRYSTDGLGSALNYGMSLCNGEFIARMDADDISVPMRLQVQAEFLHANPSVDLVGSNMEVIDHTGQTIGHRKYGLNHSAIRKQFMFRNAMAHPTVMFRRVFDDGFSYDRAFRMCEDLELWLRLLQKGYIFANINDNLVQYRESVQYHRVRENWSFNLRARVKNFSMTKIESYVSVVMSLIHFIIPDSFRTVLQNYFRK